MRIDPALAAAARTRARLTHAQVAAAMRRLPAAPHTTAAWVRLAESQRPRGASQAVGLDVPEFTATALAAALGVGTSALASPAAVKTLCDDLDGLATQIRLITDAIRLPLAGGNNAPR